MKMSDWTLHLIPRGSGSMCVRRESAFFTDTWLRRNSVSFWTLFDSWAVGTAHAGFVGTLWRIGEAEPKINSLGPDRDLLTSKWSHKISQRTLPELFKSTGCTEQTPSHSCVHALVGGSMMRWGADTTHGRDEGRNGRACWTNTFQLYVAPPPLPLIPNPHSCIVNLMVGRFKQGVSLPVANIWNFKWIIYNLMVMKWFLVTLFWSPNYSSVLNLVSYPAELFD